MSNIVLDANDHRGLRDRSLLQLMDVDRDEIVQGSDDFSQADDLV